MYALNSPVVVGSQGNGGAHAICDYNARMGNPAYLSLTFPYPPWDTGGTLSRKKGQLSTMLWKTRGSVSRCFVVLNACQECPPIVGFATSKPLVAGSIPAGRATPQSRQFYGERSSAG